MLTPPPSLRQEAMVLVSNLESLKNEEEVALEAFKAAAYRLKLIRNKKRKLEDDYKECAHHSEACHMSFLSLVRCHRRALAEIKQLENAKEVIDSKIRRLRCHTERKALGNPEARPLSSRFGLFSLLDTA